MRRRGDRSGGFTLVELLTVIGIVGLLLVVSGAAYRTVLTGARSTNERSTARQIIHAYIGIAQGNNGELMPGYANLPARDDQGRTLQPPASSRYPWRLAPALDYNMDVLYGDKSSRRLKDDRSLDVLGYQYSVSLSPALGMNGVFVGGDHQLLNPNGKASTVFGDFCVTRMDAAASPAGLLVFASACHEDTQKRVPGYFRIEAPRSVGTNWAASWSDSAPADAYGQVDFRHDRKTVAAMLDGHVTMLSFEEAMDMRLWSNQARLADQPGYSLGDH